MTHTAHAELFAGCLRVFAPGTKYGDEYLFSCSLYWLNCDEVESKRTLVKGTFVIEMDIGKD